MVYKVSTYLKRARKEPERLGSATLSQIVGEACGIGAATVDRVLAEVRAEGVDGLRDPHKPCGRPRGNDEELELCIRRLVHAKLDALMPYSTTKLHEELLKEGFDVPARTLHRFLERMNVHFGVGKMRNHMHESLGIVERRATYVAKKVEWRRPGTHRPSQPEIYLDESYCNMHHTKMKTWLDMDDGGIRPTRSGVGKRYCMVAAGCVWWDGKTMRAETVPGSIVFWDSSKKPPKRKRTSAQRESFEDGLGDVEIDTSRDYHGNFDAKKFELWFERMCQASATRYGSCRIMMDGASYHRRVECDPPPMSATKEVLKTWLHSQGVYCDENDSKLSLVQKRMVQKKLLRTCTASIAEKYGHCVLFIPAYHPELQPIERVWAMVKNPIAQQPALNMRELGSRLGQNLTAVDQKAWLAAYKAVQTVEDDYFEKIDEQVEQACLREEVAESEEI